MDLPPFENNVMDVAEERELSLRQKSESRKHKQRRLQMIIRGVGVLVLILLASTLYSQYQLHKLAQEEQQTTSPDFKTPSTSEEIVQALGRHILLPTGTPQVAEVQDAKKLQETQAFFKDAKNGDVVVVYDTAIFIYRPSEDIVIAAGDISGVGQVQP
jgi:hypothetical protein